MIAELSYNNKIKILVTYSTRTGNTEKIANAIYEAVKDKADIKEVSNANFDEYDIIILGYWLKSGTANDETVEKLSQLSGKKVILFGTLGAGDYDGYYDKSIKTVEALLPSDCKLLAHQLFRCTSIRLKALRDQHAKTPDDLGVKRLLDDYEKSSNRPDAKDLSDAQQFVISALAE